MSTKTWIPEFLAILYFGWMLTLAGCNAETIQRVCNQSFQRSEEASACFVGAMAAQEEGGLKDADLQCKCCYLSSEECQPEGLAGAQVSRCGYLNGSIQPGSEESPAEYANRRVDLYTACYKGVEGYFELN